MAFPLGLLQLLADGQGHSGEGLGEALGVSRAAIWKQIQSLRQQGVEIDAVAGEGYCLPAALELLDADGIEKQLHTASPRAHLYYEPVLGSTNQVLREHIDKQGLSCAAVATTEMQLQGRGRRGRSWQSGFAQGVLLSVAMPVACPAAQLGGLSLACGVEVAKALQSVGASDVQLKWPNDLLMDGNKLGGILIELSGESEGPCDVIVGIGLNVAGAPSADSLDEASLPAGRLQGLSRNTLVQLLSQALLKVLSEYADKGFALWREDWQALNAHQGETVVIKQGQGSVFGVCKGVDEQGALLLQAEQGEQKIFAGDVSLRVVP